MYGGQMYIAIEYKKTFVAIIYILRREFTRKLQLT